MHLFISFPLFAWQLSTRDSEGYHVLPLRSPHLFKLLLVWHKIPKKNNQKPICTHVLTDTPDWLVLLFWQRTESRPPLPQSTGQFCSLDLPATDGCCIIGTRTRDLLMIGWTLSCYTLRIPVFFFFFYSVEPYTEINILIKELLYLYMLC